MNEELFEKLTCVIREFDQNIEDYFFVDHPIFYTKFTIAENQQFDVSIEEEREEYYKIYFKFLRKFSLEYIINTMIRTPYRIIFFIKFFNEIKNKEKIFEDIYIGTEFTHRNYNEMSAIYNCCNLNNMNNIESDEEYITIYRGQNFKGYAKENISWTLNLDVAKWFANRFGGEPVILTARIPKSLIWFYTDKRNEEEIVLIPGSNISKYII